MAVMNWEQRYSVGVAELDHQHQSLLGLINMLSRTHADVVDPAEFSRTLTRLVEYAETHFAAEEHLMESSGFPEAKEHAVEHVTFTARVFDFARKMEQHDPGVQFEIVQFLKDWFVSHVLGTDKKYVSHFAMRGIQ